MYSPSRSSFLRYSPFHRPRTLHCKAHTVLAVLGRVLSYKLVTSLSCTSASPDVFLFEIMVNLIPTVSGRIAKLSSQTSTHLTTLQREILRFVLIIASLATSVAILIVILWAAWCVSAVYEGFIELTITSQVEKGFS
jgi:hypothetical protein